MSYNECSIQDLDNRNLLQQNGWECWEIRPFAFIKGKKIRAKFRIINDECIIEISRKKQKFPLSRCSFAYKTKYFHHKRIDPNKRKDEDKSFKYTPSHYGEYYVTVLVRGN